MKNFLDEVRTTPGGEHVLACIQCGTCTGSCPMAQHMEFPPRKIIAMIRAGLKEEVLKSASMWHCLSCYTCTVRCPRGVKPTELAHALESLAHRQGYKIGGTQKLYRSFVDSINGNGRVFELGMMLKYYLISNPLAALKIWRVGLMLFMRRRIPLKPARTKGKEELQVILRKYREAAE